jgi:hypothetical protein
MSVNLIGKLAGVLLLSAALSACIDAKVDVAVTSQATAKVTMTQEMGAEFYAMVKANQEEVGAASANDFCADGELTEKPDGSAVCVLTEEGRFSDLALGKDEASVLFASAGPGLVRVSLPMEEMKGELGADDGMDAESRQMIEAFFSGHSATVRFSGAEVVETNMTLADDRKSAEKIIPFLDLLNGTADLPDELYAVVRAK